MDYVFRAKFSSLVASDIQTSYANMWYKPN